MKKLSSVILLILLIFNTSVSFSFAASTANSAKSAIVIEAKTGRILYEKNAYSRMPMASTTKVMTALVALENGHYKDPVEITSESANIEGSSIYLKEGEILSLRDLLYGLMLCSGNDAANAIAKHVGGSEQEFVEKMNQKTKDLGLTNTNFTNPHGLDNSDHYTTAYDLAMISRAAMENKQFKNIVKTKLWVAERQGEGAYKYFYNKNKVLSQYKDGTGIKIGYTKISGRCLVASAEKDGMELICVVLNDPNWFNDAYNLMNAAFEDYFYIKVVEQNQVFKNMPVINGTLNTTRIVAKEDIMIPVKREEMNNITMTYSMKDTLTAPVIRGQKVGHVRIYLDNVLLRSTDVVTREDIDYSKQLAISKIRNMAVDKFFKK